LTVARAWVHPCYVSALFVLLRLLMLVAAFGMSALAPVVADAGACERACQDDRDGGACNDCPGEKSGQGCPSGCPSCHCSPARVGLPPVAEILLARVSLDVEAAAVPYEAAVPRAPPVADVYRPPCGDATLS